MREGFARMDARFAQADERFAALRADMDARFSALRADMEKRFEQVDKRFEQMDKRFEVRFEALTRHIDRFMIWSFATTLTVGALVVAAIKPLP